VTQTLAMAQALTLAVLTLTGRVHTGHVLALASILGVANAFDIPGRQSLFMSMVGKEDLISAISLNSALFNTARILGPSIAGFVVAFLGEGICFSLNAASFLAMISCLLAMRLPPSAPAVTERPLAQLVDGFRYAHAHVPVRILLAMSGAMNLALAPAMVLAPFFADAIFHRGSVGLGLLMGAMGGGAVAGVLSLARSHDYSVLPRVVLSSALIMGASMAAFAGSPAFVLSLAIMPLFGFSIMRQNAAANTMIQSSIPDAYRGRIMAIYSMMVTGMFPVGSLAAGTLAGYVGPRWAVFAGGMACLAAAFVFRSLLATVERWAHPQEVPAL
jgi:MFS family permease